MRNIKHNKNKKLKINKFDNDRNVGAIVHKRLGRHRYDVNENQMTQIKRERSILLS